MKIFLKFFIPTHIYLNIILLLNQLSEYKPCNFKFSSDPYAPYCHMSLFSFPEDLASMQLLIAPFSIIITLLFWVFTKWRNAKGIKKFVAIISLSTALASIVCVAIYYYMLNATV